MVKYPKARFSQGVIVPLEPLDLDEGAELSITILVKLNLSTIRERIKTLESSGGWSDSINGEELKLTIYEPRGNSSELRGGEELLAGGERVEALGAPGPKREDRVILVSVPCSDRAPPLIFLLITNHWC